MIKPIFDVRLNAVLKVKERMRVWRVFLRATKWTVCSGIQIDIDASTDRPRNRH